MPASKDVLWTCSHNSIGIGSLFFYPYLSAHLPGLDSRLWYACSMPQINKLRDRHRAIPFCLVLSIHSSKCPSSKKPTLIYLSLGFFYIVPLCPVHAPVITLLMFIAVIRLNCSSTHQTMSEKSSITNTHCHVWLNNFTLLFFADIPWRINSTGE